VLAFWLDPDPHGLQPADADEPSWQGAVRSAQPSARLVVRPLAPAFIVVATAQGPTALRAHWGLVPPGVKADARRATAVRLTGLPSKRVGQAPTDALWSSTARSWRCLVAATGWLADVQGQPTACKPSASRVALAGLFSRFENGQGQVVRTFGLITAWRENEERFGHHGPLVVGDRDADAWLGPDAERARSLLACRQPPVVERSVRPRRRQQF
jgi:putative SOS response-associated peptidase YedK